MSRRKSVGNLKVSGISPKKEYEKELDDLKSIGFKLNHEEAEQLKKLLDNALVKKNEWNYLNITGYRETDQVTVTYYNPV